MILYLAGCPVSLGHEHTLCTIAGLRYRLLSFADVNIAREGFSFWTSTRAPAPFFLDSGAFAASTQGTQIDLDAYCAFIEAHEAARPYASLDVIGEWRASAKNHDVMRARGLDPVPTFHMGSPAHELRRLLKEVDYLALGGVVGASRKLMQPWLDGCFSIIRAHWPKRIHITAYQHYITCLWEGRGVSWS